MGDRLGTQGLIGSNARNIGYRSGTGGPDLAGEWQLAISKSLDGAATA